MFIRSAIGIHTYTQLQQWKYEIYRWTSSVHAQHLVAFPIIDWREMHLIPVFHSIEFDHCLITTFVYNPLKLLNYFNLVSVRFGFRSWLSKLLTIMTSNCEFVPSKALSWFRLNLISFRSTKQTTKQTNHFSLFRYVCLSLSHSVRLIFRSVRLMFYH